MKLPSEAPLLYAIGLGSLLLLLVIRSAFRLISVHPIYQQIKDWFTKHLVYKTVFGHGCFHNRAYSLTFLFYLVANVCCIVIGTSDTAEIGTRSGHVALINGLFLCAGPSLHFAADLLRFPYQDQRRLHTAAGYMVGITAVIHTFAELSRKRSYPLDQPGHLMPSLVKISFHLVYR